LFTLAQGRQSGRFETLNRFTSRFGEGGFVFRFDFEDHEIWLVTATQDLYGDETLAQVKANGEFVTTKLNEGARSP